MTYQEKIAVFDLDGTLWKYNSHIEILNHYYHTSFFSSLVFRGICHFFRPLMYKVMCHLYNKIPKDFSLCFELPFNDDILKLLRKMQEDKWFVLLVTNAPYEIAYHAAERLSIPFLQAPIGHKKEILDNSYLYKTLFICTDNMEDLDLIKVSSFRKLIFTKYNKSFFEEHGYYE
jgi:hypothetical protein